MKKLILILLMCLSVAYAQDSNFFVGQTKDSVFEKILTINAVETIIDSGETLYIRNYYTSNDDCLRPAQFIELQKDTVVSIELLVSIRCEQYADSTFKEYKKVVDSCTNSLIYYKLQ